MCRFNRSHLFFAIRTNKRLQYMNAFRFLIFANDTNLPAVSLILHFIHLPFSIILPFFSLFIRKQNILPLWITFALCNRSDKAYLAMVFFIVKGTGRPRVIIFSNLSVLIQRIAPLPFAFLGRNLNLLGLFAVIVDSNTVKASTLREQLLFLTTPLQKSVQEKRDFDLLRKIVLTKDH